jgi:hypothetical protein
MLINSLEQMEQIVENNKLLSWDGWTVLENKVKENGATNKNGIRLNNRWIIQNRYELGSNGWEIPNKLVPPHEQA